MEIFDFFKEVRNKDLGKFDFNERTKVFSNDFNIEILEDIKSDLSDYIKTEALIDIKEGKTFNITGPLSSKKKTQAFKIDYSTLKNPEEFKRLVKYQQYLLGKIYELKEARKYQLQSPIRDEINLSSIKWKGTQTELTALIKSLIESDVLDSSLNQNIIFERFEKFFNFELKAYDQTKTKIRNRTKDYTPFLDRLKTSLETWIKAKDKD
jgi:hypothetical protein